MSAILVAGFLSFPGDGAIAAGGASGCPAGGPEYVQVTSNRFNAGETTHEAFRVQANGVMEWGRWNSSGLLLGHSEPRAVGREIYAKLAASKAFRRSSASASAGGEVGVRAVSFDLAKVSRSATHFSSATELPQDLQESLKFLERNLVQGNPRQGYYIWTMPYPRVGAVDVVLSRNKCDGPLGPFLANAIKEGRLIVKVDERARGFFSGERQYRTAFGADFPGGYLLFGLVAVK